MNLVDLHIFCCPKSFPQKSVKLYDVLCTVLVGYSAVEHNQRTAQAESAFGFSRNLCAFFGGTTTSLRDRIASRFSMNQRYSMAQAIASTHASCSTRIDFAKLFERFSSASSASSSDRCEASNRKSSCGRGMARDLSLSSDKVFEMWGLTGADFDTFRGCNASVI